MNGFLAAYAAASVIGVVIATGIAGWVGRSGFPLPAEERRIGCVDGLRGYLALSVLLHHSYVWLQTYRLGGDWLPPTINFLNQLGVAAVGLFFMATGLVFYPRILAGLRGTSWRGVYVSRVFRIVPLVVASIGLMTAIILARGGGGFDRSYFEEAGRWIIGWENGDLLGYVFSGRINAYVLWSLWYEWLFYLCVLPVSAGLMELARRVALPSWIVPAVLLAAGVIARMAFEDPRAETSVMFFLPLFATGMLAFELQQSRRVREALASKSAGMLATVALLSGMILTRFPDGVSIPLFGFFFICVACGNSLFGLLTRRSALVLGECSFSIYLLHGIVLSVLFVDTRAIYTLSTLKLLVVIPAAAAVVAVVTPLTFLAIERPAIRLGRRLARPVAGRG